MPIVHFNGPQEKLDSLFGLLVLACDSGLTACLLAESPEATLSIEGFGSIVTSTAAPIANLKAYAVYENS